MEESRVDELKLAKAIENHIKNGSCSSMAIPNEDLKLVAEALVERHARRSGVEAGDVVTDYGYHGEVVVTQIRSSGCFQGYYVSDGSVVSGLHVMDFEKIADKSGEWKSCRGGVYFKSADKKIIERAGGKS